MKVPYFVPSISLNDKKEVVKALDSRWLTNGPNLKNFEKKFKKFIETKYAIGVGSATQSLHLSMQSLGIGSGDEVIIPTFTFAATANAAIYCGAKPIFVDVHYDTFNMDPSEVKKKITKKTKAIIPVHYGGQSCDMDEILSLSKKYELKVIEDCAHALGTSYKNTKCGKLGIVGCFSFYPTKIITTGEGGMVTTNSNEIYKKIKILRSQGMNISPYEREKKAKWRYDIVDLGYNYRLDEIRSSLGVSQLRRVGEFNKKRIKIAKKYHKLISKIKGICIPTNKEERNHIYHLYTIKIENEYQLTRDELFQKLYKNGIGTSVQYFPLHLMSYYKKKYFHNASEFPVANDLKDKVLCLPIYPDMKSKDIEYVVENLKIS